MATRPVCKRRDILAAAEDVSGMIPRVAPWCPSLWEGLPVRLDSLSVLYSTTSRMARKIAALGLAALLGGAAAGSVELNADNFESQVFASGKHAFIKFQAPW